MEGSELESLGARLFPSDLPKKHRPRARSVGNKGHSRGVSDELGEGGRGTSVCGARLEVRVGRSIRRRSKRMRARGSGRGRRGLEAHDVPDFTLLGGHGRGGRGRRGHRSGL